MASFRPGACLDQFQHFQQFPRGRLLRRLVHNPYYRGCYFERVRRWWGGMPPLVLPFRVVQLQAGQSGRQVCVDRIQAYCPHQCHSFLDVFFCCGSPPSACVWLPPCRGYAPLCWRWVAAGGLVCGCFRFHAPGPLEGCCLGSGSLSLSLLLACSLCLSLTESLSQPVKSLHHEEEELGTKSGRCSQWEVARATSNTGRHSS